MKRIILPAFALLFTMTVLLAQNAGNFSGKWELDRTKSVLAKPQADYDGTIVRQITQNKSAFTYRDIYIRPDGSDWSTANEVFTLGGKEQIKKRGNGTTRKSVKWSEDRKTLELIYREAYVEKGVTKELSLIESYKLSDDGKTLTMDAISKSQVTGETKTTHVYHKK